MFEADPETEGIVMIGEIGGTDEEQAAAYIKKHVAERPSQVADIIKAKLSA